MILMVIAMTFPVAGLFMGGGISVYFYLSCLVLIGGVVINLIVRKKRGKEVD